MKKLIFAVIASVAAMGAAQAQSQMIQRPYIGVGVASADHNSNVPGATNGSSDGFKASGKVFGGFDISNMWGVEAGYTDFRKSDSTYTYNALPGRATTDGHAVYIAGKVTAPINDQVSVFGKLGAARNKATLTATDPILNRSESKTGVYAGVGAQYKLSEQVALTAEYERYGKNKDFGPKADVWTVGAKYSF